MSQIPKYHPQKIPSLSLEAMGSSKFPIILLLLTLLRLAYPASDTITPGQPLTSGQTLVSAGGSFELGFFNPAAAAEPYGSFLGIWYHNIPSREIIWVANRQALATGPNATLSLTAGGDLLILPNHTAVGGGSALWSTNTSGVENPSLKLLDTGNLVLAEGWSRGIVWQSFDHPSDAFLAGMELGLDLTRGIEKRLMSWRAADDPSPGGFTYGVRRTGSSELVVWNGSRMEYRTGPWTGTFWSGIPQMNSDLHFIFHFVVEPDKIYYSYVSVNKTVATVITLNPDGGLQRLVWLAGGWRQYWRLPEDKCDEYGTCGAFGICNVYYSEGVCKCLRGYEPRLPVDWTLRDFSGGCKRRTPLVCGSGGGDGFVKVSGVKPPDTERVTVAAGGGNMGPDDCGAICLRNCSCVAYALLGGSCLWWVGELMDVKEFSTGRGGVDVYLRLAASELDSTESGSGKNKPVAAIVIPLVLASIAVFCFGLYLIKRKRKHGVVDGYVKESRGKEMELPLFDMLAIENATDNFCYGNKLGEGGFGPVYKGRLGDGQDIAVKRLSRYSVQGLDEFMNEVMLIAKLQHRNLVRLLGCCIQKEERLLIYEYMPNRSLDAFIFDKANSCHLDWKKRFEIILGIARGLLYLHQDSRLKIIHRDLKVSNVLLDKEMNPKISDFGMARIFRGDQMQESTEKVVGTYGYMSPEYAMHGIFSVKSDVFSFGVIVLEILTGKKNRVFDPNEPHVSLVGHAWKLWSENRSLELVDDTMQYGYSESEVLRCMLVGLLCVQEVSDDRPTMASVVLMLGSEGMLLPQPKRPGFYPREASKLKDFSTSDHVSTGNDITHTMVHGR